jgi:integrase
MVHLPFSVSRRKGRRFYYVQFKGEDGKYLSAISTRQTSEAEAIETAFKWYREGRPVKNGGNVTPALRAALRNVESSGDADFVCRELKRRGFLKSYTVPESRQAVDFVAFLQNFWDYDSSPYIREKLRRDHGIHRNYTEGQKLTIKKHWEPVFRGRLLGDITRQDIDAFSDRLSTGSLSAGRKNVILKAGIIPLRWAFSKEILEKDVTMSMAWFSGESAKRKILSPEIVQAIFRVEWLDERSRLANMLASVTGLRVGEICGLRVRDVGSGCLYIQHSWNCRDKLKTPKNNEVRTVEVPFPFIMGSLLQLADRNPHGTGPDSFIFWAKVIPGKPAERYLFLAGLRDALVKAGMDAVDAAEYDFHGWRHFFTAYMRDRLNKKLLKSQTGHKTDPMLEHYGNHLLDGDRERIRQAQLDVFGELIPVYE